MAAADDRRETLVYQAKLAEEAERYDDMVKTVKELAEMDVQLNVEERNLLSVAYKNVVGARRASWRVLSSIESKEKESGKDERVRQIGEYRKRVEDELEEICNDLLQVLDGHLIPNDGSTEGEVFYQKMAGDYYRYLAEFATGDGRKTKADKALEKYEAATTAATNESRGLPPTNPIRLGLALNFSVFHYEIQGQPQRACHLAKEAFDNAIAELDSLPEEQYKDATLIMQLIRDNLTLWTSDADVDGDDGKDGPDGTNVQDVED